MIATIIIFIFTLLILVLVHEFGHFIMGVKFGVKILEFGFGLPPRLFGKKIGETIVSLNVLPIGGFVRLFGEDEIDEKVITSKGSFGSIPVIQRIVIVIAGVVMNLALAALLFWIVLFSKGFQEKIPLILPFNFAGVTQVNENVILVGNISDKSPAFYAGIKSGDRVTAVNGNQLASADDFINTINKNAGEAVTLNVVDPDDLSREVTVVPRSNPPQNQGPIGVSLGQITMANISYTTLPQKIFAGFIQSYNYTLYSLQIFGHLLSQSIATKNIAPVAQTVSGPVGVTQLASSVLETSSPLMPYLNLVALLSLNLAIINIFPFPALDGGRLLFLLIELISRKRVNVKFEKAVHTAGMIFLLGLIVLITYSDIKKLLP